MEKNRKGFTLIELLVVIAIIALLTTLAVTALDSARRKSRDSKRLTDIKQIQTALELYFNDEEGYPNGSYTLGEGTSCASGTAACNCLASGVAGFSNDCSAAESLYMGLVPANIQPGGVSYVYTCRANGENDPTVCGGTDQGAAYTISFNLEGSVEGIPAGDHCAVPSGIIDGLCP